MDFYIGRGWYLGNVVSVAVAIGAPALIVWAAHRLTYHRATGLRWAAMFVACVLALAVALFVLLQGLFYPPPGVGRFADHGRTVGTPVVDALQRYRAQRGAYPTQLLDLMQIDSGATQRILADSMEGRLHWSYLRTADGYNLSFHYEERASDTCSYTPSAPRWICGGLI